MVVHTFEIKWYHITIPIIVAFTILYLSSLFNPIKRGTDYGYTECMFNCISSERNTDYGGWLMGPTTNYEYDEVCRQSCIDDFKSKDLVWREYLNG